MCAYKVPLHRVFKICKTRFYLPRCISKTRLSDRVFTAHAMRYTRNLCGKINVTIFDRITIHTRLLDTAKLTLLITRFGNKLGTNATRFLNRVFNISESRFEGHCGTLKCENAAICEKVAKCEKISTLNVKIDAICEKITLNVTKLGSLNVSNFLTLNVLKSTLYVQTLF